jgi:hypothetical protein
MTRKQSRKSGPNIAERQWRMYRFLYAHPVGVLSSVTPDHDPHGAVVYFSIDKAFNIYFLTKNGTRKYDNITHNNHVMLTVFDPVTQTTAQVTGIAHEIADSVLVNSVAGSVLRASLDTSDSGIMPITNLQAGDYAGFMIKPKSVRMAVYSEPHFGDYMQLFQSIESFDLDLS